MKRPESGYLGDGLYELRILRAGQRHRILYGFYDRDVLLLLSAFAKSESRVPASEIRVARERFGPFVRNPLRHSHVVKTP